MTDLQKQLLLAYMGCLTVEEVDGIWGIRSAKATQTAQERLGVPSDGVWGPRTEQAVREHILSGEMKTEKAQTGTFWDHIRYWTREEFRCRCGEYHVPYCDGFPAEPDRTLVELVDDIRHDLGAPGIRSSGIRCSQHNADSGGVARSKHMEGKALDFRIEGVSGRKLLERALQDQRTAYAYVIGDGPYVHVDVN